MSRIEKMSVAVTPPQAEAVRVAVQTGEYASSSEVIREALRLWIDARAKRAQAIADLREAVEEGIASGRSPRRRSAEEIIAEGIRSLAAQKAV